MLFLSFLDPLVDPVDVPRQGLRPGDRVLLHAASPGAGMVVAARSRAAFRLHWEAIDRGDEEAALRLRQDGLIVAVRVGTAAIVRGVPPKILIGPEPPCVRVAIDGGAFRRSELWVAGGTVERSPTRGASRVAWSSPPSRSGGGWE